MLTEIQRVNLQWFLIFVIVACVLRLSWIFTNYILDRRRYKQYADEHFEKVEEYWHGF